jgi:A/G-specific adenine glycosylase
VVDGNVYRVLARHYGIATPINTTVGKKEFTELAQDLLLPALNREGKGAALFNQAMMDFGAIQCTPVSPRCEQCPLAESCVAFREGRIDILPVKQKTLKVKERQLTYIYIRCNGYTALHRRPAGDIWQGLYEPWLTDQVPQGAVLQRQRVKHVLTHRILYADFWLWETEERPQLPDDYFWIKEEEVGNYGVPRLIEILLESLNT